MAAALTMDELFGSPDHYLHSFEGDQAVFVPMDRAAYARSIFLDQRIQPAGKGAMRVPAGVLAGAAAGRRVLPTAWIFISRIADRRCWRARSTGPKAA